MLTRCYDHREEDYSMSLKRINCYHYCQLGRKNYLHYFTQLYCFFQKLSPIDFPLWLTLNGLGSLGATTGEKKKLYYAASTFGIQSLHDDALPQGLQKGSKTPLRFHIFTAATLVFHYSECNQYVNSSTNENT